MATARRLFPQRKTDTKFVFKVQAATLSAKSEWSSRVAVHTSKDDAIEFPDGAVIAAVPRYWTKDIFISWTPALDITLKTYRIFRSIIPIVAELPDVNKTKDSYYFLADTTVPFYTDTDITEEVTYYYWVCCVDNDNKVGGSLGQNNAEWGKPNTPVITDNDSYPETKTNTTFPFLSDVRLQWQCEDGCEYYHVQLSLNVLGVYLPWSFPIKVDHITGDTYQYCTIPLLLTGATYKFRVTAINIWLDLESDQDDDDDIEYTVDHDLTAPLAVTNVDATLIWDNRQASITWTPRFDLAEEVVKYRIYRRLSTNSLGANPTTPTKVDELEDDEESELLTNNLGEPLEIGGAWTGFHLDDLTDHKDQYAYYWVSAVDKWDLEGDLSDPDSVSFLPPKPVSSDSMLISYDEIFNFFDIVRASAVRLRDWDNILEANGYEIRWRWNEYREQDDYAEWLEQIEAGVGWGEWSANTWFDEFQSIADGVVFTVIGRGLIEFGITAKNKAGPSVETTRRLEIGADMTAPSRPTGLEGIPVAFGNMWWGSWLSWETHEWYEGVRTYKIKRAIEGQPGKKYITIAQVLPAVGLPGLVPRTSHFDFLPALGVPGATKAHYKIIAVDTAGNPSIATGVAIDITTNPGVLTLEGGTIKGRIK